MSKATISNLLMEQAKDCLLLAIEHRNLNEIDKEVRLGLNIHLLLGLTLEGIINEIGESLLDKWTWKELEKVNTPLKWRIISGLKKGFDPSKEPMQTISELHKIRNKIAHPKSEILNSDIIIISDTGEIRKNLSDDERLPGGDLNFYIGYMEMIQDYNARVSLFNIKRVLKAIITLKKLLTIDKKLEWSERMLSQISGIEINKNEFDKE